MIRVEDKELSVHLWSHNIIGSEDFLGSVKIDFTKINNITDSWFPLKSRDRPDEIISGEIRLKITHVLLFLSGSSSLSEL